MRGIVQVLFSFASAILFFFAPGPFRWPAAASCASGRFSRARAFPGITGLRAPASIADRRRDFQRSDFIARK
jgi:hypothetical protein